MSWSESVDEALCFGWIDGVRKRVDDASYTIRFTPRKPTSIWSAVNIAKVAQLRAQGRMTAAGEEAFARRTAAKSAVYAHEQATSAELSAAELHMFKSQQSAWHFFEKTPPGYQKVMLHWICSAKRPETRSTRLAKLVQACVMGLRLR
ncbi:YdeI/OmpD-associated family protein [Variovorax sp. HJSM1_2]|uniref:YdeI/OmpD-associated family protein n=1 Tax=Variovorax sp. HJSM1_2 TaxID=3366263 RepID=UPI003BC0D0E5